MVQDKPKFAVNVKRRLKKNKINCQADKDKTDETKKNSNKIDKAGKECVNPAAVKSKQTLETVVKTHDDLTKKLTVFANKEMFTRRDLVTLVDIVAVYTELSDVEISLARAYKVYLDTLKVSEVEAEASSQYLKPSTIDKILESSALAISKSMIKFKQMKETHPDSQQVVDYLDFVVLKSPSLDKASNSSASSKKSKPVSDMSALSISGLRAKVSKAMNEYDKKLESIKKDHSEAVTSGDIAAYKSVIRQLEKLESKSSPVITKLTEKLEQESEATPEDVNSLEEWHGIFSASVDSLSEAVHKFIDKNKEINSTKRSDFSTYFKKQDPPRFKGDCIEYLEWKKRWISQVSSHSPPSDFEIDLLKKNIPDEGKKKLFGCESLTTAWLLLDKMYGDQKLIVQKLKLKLRNLKPKSKEAHEIVIEIADEVEYLVKRLRLLNAVDVLSIDNDFLNSIYKHLPEQHRQKWDDYDFTGYPSEWAGFMAFCHDIYSKAIVKRTRMESIKAMDSNPKSDSSSNSKVGAVTVDHTCTDIKIATAVQKSDDEEKFKAKAEKYGECKVCKQRHTFVNRFTKKTLPSDKYLNCEAFKSLNKVERGKVIERNRSCRRCLSWSHDVSACTMKPVACKEKINGSECGRDHSKLVCGSGIMYCLNVNWKTDDVDETVPSFPLMEDIRVDSGTARTVYDGGSQRVLIDDNFAREQGLKSVNVVVNLELPANKSERLETRIYQLNLYDRNGNARNIWGYGCDRIMSPYDPVDLNKVRHLFPELPADAFQLVPARRIDILLGLNFFGLHPRGQHYAVENLVAERSIFSNSGWCIGGSHPLLGITSTPQLTYSANMLKVAQLQFHPERLSVHDSFAAAQTQFAERLSTHDSIAASEKQAINSKMFALKSEPMLNVEYWETDNLGVEPPRRCSRCRQCQEKGECSESHVLHTLQDQAELDLINDGIEVKDGVTYSTWGFIKDPYRLGDNRQKVIATQARLFSNLAKEGVLDQYNDQIRAGIQSNLWSELSPEELDAYEGPVNYLTHHAIIKDSTSTPLRVVHNSSLRNGTDSLNSILPRGPSQLSDMLEVTLRFRVYECCFGADLKKAYNTIQTGIVERNLRRFVWKFSEEEDWKTFGINKVHFGEINAANELECAKRKIAKTGIHIDEEAAQKLLRDSYVDDIFSGGKESTVNRMVGEKQLDGSRAPGTMSEILNIGGFRVKEFVVEGDPDQNEENLLSNSVFGYAWDSIHGQLSLKFKPSLVKKTRSRKIRPVISKEDLSTLHDAKLTKRNLLGITNSFGDFLGIAEPFLIRFRLLMKDLFDSKDPLLWDDMIPLEKKNAWISLISEAVQAEEIVFPRRCRPDNAIGGPVIAGLGDGAIPAFGACIYLIWEHKCPLDGLDCDHEGCEGSSGGGHFSSYVILAKARVTPLQGFTTPRSELSAGVLLSRLGVRVSRALGVLDSDDKPVNCIFMLDSECTIATLESSSTSLKPFFLNRKQEIIENMESIRKVCPLEPVQWIPSQDNISDLLTRGTATVGDISQTSAWQHGPDFFRHPRCTWPTSRKFISDRKSKIPLEERRSAKDFLRVAAIKTKTGESVMPQLFTSVNEILSKSNDYENRKRVLARVIKGWGNLSIDERKKRVSENLSREDLIKAEYLILLSSMPETVEALQKGSLDSLLPYRSGSLIMTRGRLGEGVLQSILGISELVILMPSSRAAELIMWSAHRGYSGLLHRSVAETVARSRNFAWIVKPKDLAKKICYNCYECRRNRRVLQSQQMARLREESSTICPPWTFVSLDYAGPFIIKGETNRRSRSKCWIIVYVCRSTKAVCLLPTAGYDTDSFLLRHEEFVSRKGLPRSIVSDRGSNLVKSGIIIAEKNSPAGWNWDKVVSKNAASSWSFVPVGAQHRNGLAEATVKILKQSLGHALPAGVILSFVELNTLCARISYAINSRPLGLSNVSHSSQQNDFLNVVTPNQLLLGRSGESCPPLDYEEEDGRYTRRLAYVSSVYNSWWKQWIRQVLPTLVPIRRWRKARKNLSVGDIVLIEYPNPLAEDYRVGRVTGVKKGQSGLVRTVTVGYRKKNVREDPITYRSKKLVEEEMAVQRLSLLVPVTEQVGEVKLK